MHSTCMHHTLGRTGPVMHTNLVAFGSGEDDPFLPMLLVPGELDNPQLACTGLRVSPYCHDREIRVPPALTGLVLVEVDKAECRVGPRPIGDHDVVAVVVLDVPVQQRCPTPRPAAGAARSQR